MVRLLPQSHTRNALPPHPINISLDFCVYTRVIVSQLLVGFAGREGARDEAGR